MEDIAPAIVAAGLLIASAIDRDSSTLRGLGIGLAIGIITYPIAAKWGLI